METGEQTCDEVAKYFSLGFTRALKLKHSGGEAAAAAGSISNISQI